MPTDEITARAETMIADEVMTRNVISIAPEATVEEAVNLMLSRGVSGLFVVDTAGDLAGVITEGDLLRRDEIGTGQERPWWLRMLLSPSRQAADFTRANGRHVRDVMTPDVIAVAHDCPLESVVAAMEKHRIKRLPVTRDGRVVGVVSRTDLLRALTGQVHHAAPADTDDATLRATIMESLQSQPWAPTTTLNVTVANGAAGLWGSISNENERNAIRVVVENTPGVTAVNDHLVYIEPFTGTVIEPPERTK